MIFVGSSLLRSLRLPRREEVPDGPATGSTTEDDDDDDGRSIVCLLF